MDPSLIAQNVLSPPILFFALGLIATWVRSDLAVPPAVAKALSVYLLFAIGFHGGVELYRSGFEWIVIWTLGAAILASFLLPMAGYMVLRLRIRAADAAGIAACYGSVSAVTFITAISFLDRTEVAHSGYMVAAMALMESPAIISGVLLARWASRSKPTETPASPVAQPAAPHGRGWRALTHEALANGAVLLLLGSLVIGYLTGDAGWDALRPLVKEPFQGLLCLFLLDMGLVAAKRLGDLRQSGMMLLAFALLAPLAQAGVGIVTARALGLQPGDALLLTILFASASYIAVPAALRLALPDANPSLYLPMSLGVTFPLNIAVGIPLYMAIIEWWWMT
ncbi:sodium-dependent bicarbonate transport family permease [Phycisphaerales bacterium AB-hyl4]|uniref:Sodium-dependent bicarbonate transport family permease n=1 Tax=Natronomicrosphaera hydrolytica TaxID=3242702 RepID=A0ABV4U2G0_9BACT